MMIFITHPLPSSTDSQKIHTISISRAPLRFPRQVPIKASFVGDMYIPSWAIKGKNVPTFYRLSQARAVLLSHSLSYHTPEKSHHPVFFIWTTDVLAKLPYHWVTDQDCLRLHNESPSGFGSLSIHGLRASASLCFVSFSFILSM